MRAILSISFQPWLRRRRLRRVFALRRAWQQVMDSPDPDVASRLASELSLVRPPISKGMLRLSGLGQDLHAAVETTLVQVLLVGLYDRLMPGLLLNLTGGRANLPIPRAWREHLKRRSIRVNDAACARAFALAGLLGLARGARQVLRSLRQATDGFGENERGQPYDVAVQLPGAFLRSETSDPSTSFVAWLQHKASTGRIWLQSDTRDLSTEGRRIVGSPLPTLPGPITKLVFAIRSLRLMLAAGAGILVGRSELACILPETVMLAHARCLAPQDLARTYVFENSRWFLRPLFTRWANHAAGSKAILAFYSSNNDECLRLGPASRDPSFIPGYESMDWDGYLVWDEHHAALVKAWGHAGAEIGIVGPIPLTDSDAALPHIPARSLAVFDIAPFSPARLAAMGLVPQYYRDEIAARFLDDLCEQAAAQSFTLVLKQKRERKRIGTPRYDAAVRRLLDTPNVVVLDPQISASRVTAVCQASVSMPFSSPSIIAAHQGRPSAFYDPTGRLIASRRQAHDLPVLAGPESLRTWLASLRR